MRINIRTLSSIMFVSTLCFSDLVSADGNSIDKVYHPYVLPLETEIEWRTISQHDNDETLDNQQTHRLGIGSSFFENWFTEIYLIGEKTSTEDFEVNATKATNNVSIGFGNGQHARPNPERIPQTTSVSRTRRAN